MQPQLQRAILLIQQKRFSQAEGELRKLLIELPDNSQVLSWLAIALVEQEKYVEAEEIARKAVASSPDDGFSFYTLGNVLLLRHKFAEAQKAVEQSLEISPFSPDALGLLAQTYNHQKEWSKGLEAAERGLSFDAENITCNNMRAQALVSLGRATEAAATLKTSLNEDPDDAYTHANLGWTNLRQGEAKQARTHFIESLRLDPTCEWAQLGLVESIKSRFFLYRWLLRMNLWFAQNKAHITLVILLGLFFGNQIIVWLSDKFPTLSPWLTPIIIAYIALVLLTWFGEPIADLVLQLHPLGRRALKPEKRRTAYLIGALLLGFIGCGIATWLSDAIIPFYLCLSCFYLMFPAMAWRMSPAVWPKRLMLGYFLAMVIWTGVLQWNAFGLQQRMDSLDTMSPERLQTESIMLSLKLRSFRSEFSNYTYFCVFSWVAQLAVLPLLSRYR